MPFAANPCFRLLPILLLAAVVTAQDGATARDRYNAIEAEYNQALARARNVDTRAQTEAEKKAVKFPDVADWAPRFQALADEFPKDPVAADCLAWVLAGVGPQQQGAALDTLLKNHLRSKTLERVCQGLGFLGSPKAAPFLRTLVSKSPHREVQGQAAFALGNLLLERSDASSDLHQGDELRRKSLLEQLGQAAVDELASADPIAMRKEAEKSLELVQKKYAELETFMPLGRQATIALFELHHLAVGMLAPDIVGTDAELKKLRLSDYRGKVVVLVFWPGAFGSLLPQLRALQEKYAGEPFAIVGVSTARSRDELLETQLKERITWRSFPDGQPPNDPIAMSWNVFGWPTIHVLDPLGIIRFKHVRDERLDQAVERLIAEAKPHGKSK